MLFGPGDGAPLRVLLAPCMTLLVWSGCGRLNFEGARLEAGADCDAPTDCVSGVCEQGICQVGTCTDGVRNQGETGVDCGAGCDPCAAGDGCEDHTDCASRTCFESICREEGCIVAGQYLQDGADDPQNPCMRCDAALAPSGFVPKQMGAGCADGLSCTTSSCDSDGRCVGVPDAMSCAIDGQCYAEGASDPSNMTRFCNPDSTPTSWSDASCIDGYLNQDESDLDCGGVCGGCELGEDCTLNGDCGTNTCFEGTCRTQGCMIDGQLYADGAANPGNPCQVCDNGLDPNGWSAASSDVVCSDGFPCTIDRCNGLGSCVGTPDGSSCLVAGQCRTDGELNGTDPGRYCNPNLDPRGWSTASCIDGYRNQNEIGVDCGGSCSGCGTPASCMGHGDCASNTCFGGTCAPIGCVIGGMLYPEGASNPSNVCQRCTNGASVTSWSNRAAGAACSDGLACTIDACDGSGGCAAIPAAGRCAISGGCYSDGDLRAGNPQNYCNASQDPVDWSVATCSDGYVNRDETDVDCGGVCAGCPLGDACAAHVDCASNTCVGGTCAARGCVIGGTYYVDGAPNPSRDCQQCQNALSITSWSNLRPGAPCSDGLGCTVDSCSGSGACIGAPNASSCVIGGACRSDGELQSGDSSNYCNPAVSQRNWTTASCTDGYLNQGETIVDAGGPCPIAAPHCSGGSDPWTVSLYTFESPSSAFSDVAGSNPATVAGAAASTVSSLSGCGDALSPGGTTYGHIAHAPSLALTEGSIDAFVRVPDVIPSLWPAAVFAKDNLGTSPDGQLNLFLTDEGRVVARMQQGGSAQFRCSSEVYDPGAWLHVGVNIGSPNLELYVNGTRQNYTGNATIGRWKDVCAGGTQTAGLASNNLDAFIGANNWTMTPPFGVSTEVMTTGGAIDSLRISDARRDYSTIRRNCSNGAFDSGETAADCGGICGTGCAIGQACDAGSDCSSGVCSAGSCASPSCADRVRNGSETGVDCGGGCGPCDNCANHPGAVFCTSFENPSYPEFENTTVTGSGDVRATEQRAYRGANSLRVHARFGTDRAFLSASDIGNIASGDLYIRFYLFRLPGSTYSSGATRHLFRISNSGADWAAIGINIKDGDSLEYALSNHGSVAYPKTDPGSLKVGQWQCVQFHARLASGTAGFAELAIDGVTYSSAGHDTRPVGPGHRAIDVGYYASFLNISRESVLLDDLVIATTPIACD